MYVMLQFIHEKTLTAFNNFSGDFRFIRNSQESQQVAALLDKLLENQTEVNWYGSFTQALRENGNT